MPGRQREGQINPDDLKIKKVGGKNRVVLAPAAERHITKEQLTNRVAGMGSRIAQIGERITKAQDVLSALQTELADVTARRSALQAIADQAEE